MILSKSILPIQLTEAQRKEFQDKYRSRIKDMRVNRKKKK